jgi:hypothetical protein
MKHGPGDISVDLICCDQKLRAYEDAGVSEGGENCISLPVDIVFDYVLVDIVDIFFGMGRSVRDASQSRREELSHLATKKCSDVNV